MQELHGNKNHLKNQLLNWWKVDDLIGCVSINLTFKMWTNGRALDDISASQNYRHFLNLLCAKCFGSAFKRYGKRIQQINVIEKKNGRWHTHGIMKVPPYLSNEHFEKNIISSWKKTDWGNKQYVCNWHINEGWISYMTKFKNNEDHVDFLNYTWDC